MLIGLHRDVNWCFETNCMIIMLITINILQIYITNGLENRALSFGGVFNDFNI